MHCCFLWSISSYTLHVSGSFPFTLQPQHAEFLPSLPAHIHPEYFQFLPWYPSSHRRLSNQIRLMFLVLPFVSSAKPPGCTSMHQLIFWAKVWESLTSQLFAIGYKSRARYQGLWQYWRQVIELLATSILRMLLNVDSFHKFPVSRDEKRMTVSFDIDRLFDHTSYKDITGWYG